MKYTWTMVRNRVATMLDHLGPFASLSIYPIPRGGVFPALIMAGLDPNICIVDNPESAAIFVDDIVDSGDTRNMYQTQYGPKPFISIVNKQTQGLHDWVRFPWDSIMEDGDEGDPTRNVTRMLQFIGEDVKREGLRDTPQRVTKAWQEMFCGYKDDVTNHLTTFTEGACDEMVVLKDIHFTSYCEHHILPFHGTASIAYLPDNKVIGVSKLVRVLEVFSKRLQIQERLCQQVTTALDDHLKPRGAACIIKASHMCMQCRGVRQQESHMITSSLTGLFKSNLAARHELLTFLQ